MPNKTSVESDHDTKKVGFKNLLSDILIPSNKTTNRGNQKDNLNMNTQKIPQMSSEPNSGQQSHYYKKKQS